MPKTQQRILAYIAENRTATVLEISRIFNMTPANIRHHLGILVDKNRLIAERIVNHSGRGRPRYEYRLTAAGQENSFAELAVANLNWIASQKSKVGRERSLKALAAILASNYENDIGWSPKRLRAAVIRLNELKYRAHWEARIEGPQVRFGQCPYAQIIHDHPILCQMDSYLLEELLGVKVEQLAKIGDKNDGANECIFKTEIPAGKAS